MFLYEITNRFIKNDYQFFDALKTRDHKIRGYYNLLIKVRLHKSERSSPLKHFKNLCRVYECLSNWQSECKTCRKSIFNYLKGSLVAPKVKSRSLYWLQCRIFMSENIILS